jgi:UDP-N-acetylglucosamine 2-epimerase
VQRLLAVVGNRPQFVKAAPLHAALRGRADVRTVDTGQHYDHELAGLFYEELGIDPPDHHLGVGSGSHGAMTARIMERLEPVMTEAEPDAVIVYGDTNSTIAAALVAAKLMIPVAHVEAGLRSFDRRMPEEINRVVTDHLAEQLFCPTDVAARNLAAEGVVDGVHVVGDVMVDCARLFGPVADRMADPGAAYGVTRGAYALATVHRDHNTRQPSLGRIVDALSSLDEPVLLPLHPRTRAALRAEGLEFGGAVQVLPPVGYLEFTALLRGARVLVTDSGGAQKEAYLHGVPCVTLRPVTEWVETVEEGWNVLVGDDPERIGAAVREARAPAAKTDVYGDGHAAERIADLLVGVPASDTILA